MTATIQITCPNCQKKLRIGQQHAGKRVKCPACSAAFTASSTETGDAASSASPPAQPAPSQPAPSQPAPSQSHTPGSPAGVPQPASAGSPQEMWRMQTAEGEQFGPVPKAELDQWVAEGRVDSQCQILQEGWDQWRWADDVYPALGNSHPAGAEPHPSPAVSVPAPAVASAGPAAGLPSGAAAPPNPFTGLGETTQSVNSNPFAGLGPGSPPAAASPNPYSSPSSSPPAAAVKDASTEATELTGVRKGLSQTRPWVLFLSILMFIVCGLMLAFLSIGLIFSLGQGRVEGLFGFVAALVGGGLVYFMPAYLLFQYATRIRKFVASKQVRDLEQAVHSQRYFWMYVGIMLLVLIVIWLVIIVASFLLGSLFALRLSRALSS